MESKICKEFSTKSNSSDESCSDRLRLKVDFLLSETILLKTTLNENHEKKFKENVKQFQIIRNEIIMRTNQIVDSIHKHQKELLSQVRKLENNVDEKLNSFLVDDNILDEINENKQMLTNNKLDSIQLEKLKVNYHLKNMQLNLKLIEFEKNSDYFFEFFPNNNFKMSINSIGIIKSINKSNETNVLNRYLKSIESKQVADSDVLVEKGFLFQTKNDYDSAISFYTKATEVNTKNSRAFYLIGKCFCFKKDYLKAIESLEKAIEICPNKSSYYCLKGIVLKEKNEFSSAIECFNKAIQLNSNYPEAYYGKGVALAKRKNYSRAIYCFNKAIELNPNECCYFNKKADALFLMNDCKGALNCIKKSLRIENTNNVYAYNLKGIISFVQNNFDLAIECFQIAIKNSRNHNNANYFYNRGYAFFKKNILEQAEADFKKANELNPIIKYAYYNENANLTLFKQ